MYSPLVSIIVPLYNGSNYVREALDSAINQTYENIEIIVVNDGSNDNDEGKKAVLEYGAKVKYFEKPNGGCASALNYGIRQAKGEFISWLSHDDMYLENKISEEIKCYEKYDLSKENCLISARGALIDGNGDSIYHPSLGKNGYLNPKEVFEYLLFVRCFNGCGLLIPKSVFDKGLWFDETEKYLLDWSLWLKLAINGFEFFVLNDDLVYNRCHDKQVTVSHGDLRKAEEEKTISELSDALAENDDAFAIMLYKFAFQTGSKNLPKVETLLKNKKIKKPVLSSIKLRIFYFLRNIAKTVYHRFR